MPSTKERKIDILQNIPLIEPYADHDDCGRCLVWNRKGSSLDGLVMNTSVKEALAYVQGYRSALQRVLDGEIQCK